MTHVPSKPPTASFYTPAAVRLVRSACLTLATYLGSYLDDLVIVGGLVPTLLVPAEQLKELQEAHIGTLDLDLGLSVAILQAARYVELVGQLKKAGFEPDLTKAGGPANHRWKHQKEPVTVDFLIAPAQPGPPKSTVRVIDENLSAVEAEALPLAFKDRQKIRLEGETLSGEKAVREVWVCRPGAFIVLKALAFEGRGESKDAYDLFYVLRNWGERYVTDVADAMRPLLDDPVTKRALDIIERDFVAPRAPGPIRAAEFSQRSADEAHRADLAGAANELLRLLSYQAR